MERVLILGAAGRDFHDFNVWFRDRADVEVVAFTATQIPKIAGRRYPAELAGPRYPQGVPIVPEAELEAIVAEQGVTQVVLSYSDLSHETVMHLASRALAAGADFRLLGPRRTMLRSDKPVVAVCAVRTGCGKSPTCRYVARVLREQGRRVAVVRHPMPYGDLLAMQVQRFASREDLDAMGDGITIEEREEYEAHVDAGTVVFAGVDYREILTQAQAEADIILWDGGNNDLPFFRPDLWITLVDPHRPGHESRYHPGEANLRAADVVVVTKANTAPTDVVADLGRAAKALAPEATLVVADSTVEADDPTQIRGKRVLLIDDGPTLTHGEMPYGAGKIAAELYGAAEIVDPRPFAVGSIAELYDRFGHLGRTIPAMGYYPAQIEELAETIRRADCDAVVIATPVDLRRLVTFDKPATRVRYELTDRGAPTLREQLNAFAAKQTPPT
jgi:predicted GTPase